jgi:hypothetical protein
MFKLALRKLTQATKPLPLFLGLVLGASCVSAQVQPPPPVGAFDLVGSTWTALSAPSAALAQTLTYTPPPGALYCQYTATATSFSITSNVATVIATNTFTVGEQPLLFGFTTATYFNNQVVTIASASGSQFTFSFTHANVTSTSDTGTANLWVPATSACFGGGGGSGTVTNVTGTANQIDVATGTTTPVISLDPSLILPAGTTGLPVATGISGLGTGVATALAVNVGSAGAPVTNGGALGTPSSGVITNLTGTCSACTANAVTTIPTLTAINPQTATYQVLASDFSAYKTITAASGTFTITLVASGSQPPAGQYIDIVNYGSGFVTVARSGQNINGGTASIILGQASATGPTSTRIISDGTNYFSRCAGCVGQPIETTFTTVAVNASTNATAIFQVGSSGASADIYSQTSSASIGHVRGFGLASNGTSFTALFDFGPTVANFAAVPIQTSGFLQNVASATGGTCAMSTSTSCTITLGHTYTTPVCIVTQQSATLTGGAAGCTVSGTTVTITSAVANSETWGAWVFGNPS